MLNKLSFGIAAISALQQSKTTITDGDMTLDYWVEFDAESK